MEKNIRKKIYRIICKQLSQNSVKESDYLLRDLGGDSLDIVEISLYLEEEFNIDFGEEVWKKWKTVKDIIKHVEKEIGH